MKTEDITAEPFARRVREQLDAKGLSLAELAERAELAPSLVSKLLTDTDAARRDPRLEHVLAIARALELAPRELVQGTNAEPLLGEWVPRAELEAESKARSAAQNEASKLRTELVGVRSEAATLRAIGDQRAHELATATRRFADSESAARREQTKLRVACEAAQAQLASAEVERDRALDLARLNYGAWANARSQIAVLQRDLATAQGSASTAWIAAAIGTVGGAILGAAAAEPPPARKRRRATRRLRA